MAAKKNNYINIELNWAESQLLSWSSYVDANPIDQIEDRWGKKEMPRGGHTWVVTATREQQIKSVQETVERYLRLLEVVNFLREKEEIKKMEIRGSKTLSPFEEGLS